MKINRIPTEKEDFPEIINEYNFRCTLCANCCTGDQSVLLNLYDLYIMAGHLSMANTKQLFDDHWLRLLKIEQNVWLPQVRFKLKPYKFCPFLISDRSECGKLIGLCSLHPENKPLVCAMAPVGRIIDFESDKDEFVYVKPAPDCPGVNIKQVNYLDDLKKNYKIELVYQKRFFNILEHIKRKKTTQKVILFLKK